MFPGAVDALPLNVQLSVLPPFDISQVSVSVGPVTPKLAVATVGRVTASVAEADPPPNDAVIVAVIVPPTARVDTGNVAVVDADATVTVVGTITGSVPVNVTTAPAAGAAPLRMTVPVTD
jgi:hypothetical protein